MSKIAWTDITLNPMIGCTKVSTGCQNCYAEKMAGRLVKMGIEPYHLTITEMPEHEGDWKWKPQWTGDTVFVESALKKLPKKPKRVFINSMGDTLHEGNSFKDINKILEYIKSHPQHTFQLLTKRQNRMLEYSKYIDFKWPDNVVGLVTAENQEMADLRIPALLECRFKTAGVSCEPLLGAIHIEPYLLSEYDKASHDHQMIRPLSAYRRDNKLSWVIVGAESGHNRRTCYVEWIDELASQCEAWGTPCFVKQMFVNGKKIECPAQYPQEFPKGA